jgi:hypothetical protein
MTSREQQLSTPWLAAAPARQDDDRQPRDTTGEQPAVGEQASPSLDLLTRAAEQRRQESIALRSESRQAQRRALELRRSSAILRAVETIVSEVLTRRGFGLARPVTATFSTAASGSTGVAVSIQLKDPADVAGARAAIVHQFGAAIEPDIIHVS